MAARYFVLIKPWAIYVKEEQFFEQQGGLQETWGKEWLPVEANSIDHARTIGEQMRENNPEKYH